VAKAPMRRKPVDLKDLTQPSAELPAAVV